MGEQVKIETKLCSKQTDPGAAGEAPAAVGQGSGPRGPQQLVAAVAQDRSGALAVLRRGIVPEAITDPIPLHGPHPQTTE